MVAITINIVIMPIW